MQELATCSQSQRTVQSMVSAASWLNARLWLAGMGRGAAHFQQIFDIAVQCVNFLMELPLCNYIVDLFYIVYSAYT